MNHPKRESTAEHERERESKRQSPQRNSQNIPPHDPFMRAQSSPHSFHWMLRSRTKFSQTDRARFIRSSSYATAWFTLGLLGPVQFLDERRPERGALILGCECVRACVSVPQTIIAVWFDFIARAPCVSPGIGLCARCVYVCVCLRTRVLLHPHRVGF